MEQFKRAQVIMLPTNNKSLLHINYSKLQLNKFEQLDVNNQHLYIISDDKIKKGDWCYDKSNNRIVKIIYKHPKTKSHYFVSANVNTEDEILKKGYSVELEELKKIIATTDTSLTITTYYEIEGNQQIQLPQPSQQFIEKYIESYDKSEVITDVLVEYEFDKVIMACTCKDNSIGCSFAYYDGIDECCRKRFPNGEYWNKTYKVKINPKDNTITIRKLKDSWNREELINKLKKFNCSVEIDMSLDKFNKWIEENL